LPETDTTAPASRVTAFVALALLAGVAVFAYVVDRISKVLAAENVTLHVPVQVVGQLLASAVVVFIPFFVGRMRSVAWAVPKIPFAENAV